MKRSFFATILICSILVACNNKQTTDNDMEQKLELTQEWDKVFPLSEKVNHKKVTFKTQYGLTLAADLYTPKDSKGKMANVVSWHWLSTLPIRVRAAVNRVVQLRPTSIPRTLWLLSISCRSRTM